MLEFLIFLIVSFIFISVCIYQSFPKSNIQRMKEYLDECERLERGDMSGLKK